MQRIWYRKGENAWFLTVRENGRQKQIKLLKGSNTKGTREQAEQLAIQELANRPQQPSTPAASWITVGHVLDGFLRHSQEEHDPPTYTWYKSLLDSFKARCGSVRITMLKKHHVQAWLKEKGYNPTSQNRALGAIKRAFNWAVEEEYIARNPVAHVRKPNSLVRDRVLTADERQLILGSSKDECFRDFVAAMSLTGCRPGEVARVSAEHVDLERGLWVFTKHKTVKKTGRPRIVYLCPDALQLTKRLIAKHPAGPIFRNTRGQPWTRNAIRIRFRNLRRKHPQLKGVIAYTYRSSFATDALEAGVPDATVSALLGHVGGTATLHKFYARLSHKVDHLKDAAAKATQDRPQVHGAPPDTAA